MVSMSSYGVAINNDQETAFATLKKLRFYNELAAGIMFVREIPCVMSLLVSVFRQQLLQNILMSILSGTKQHE